MTSPLQHGFRLGPWRIEPLRGAVTATDGETQHLQPKVMDVFVQLAEQANQLVPRDRLLDAVWNGDVAADELLTRSIGEIRRALQDDPGNPKYIETVPKRGYRLIGRIQIVDEKDSASIPSGSQSGPKLDIGARHLVIVSAIALSLVYLGFSLFKPDLEKADFPGITSVDNIDGDRWTMSVAVLPFVNMSDDYDNDYLADGLSEEILNLLARTPGLKVIGRTSSFSFKGKDEDLRTIGVKLGVKSILEGSVRISGDHIRVTAQLVDASNGALIWSESYDRTMTDIFSVQDDVATAITDALQIHVAVRPSRGRPTENTAAYALFLKARARVNISEYQNAEELLLQATALDPEFAEAFELLAYTYRAWDHSSVSIAHGKELTGEAAAKALEIDPDRDFSRALLESATINSYSPLRVIEALERTIIAQPSNAEALRALSYDLLGAGYLRDAIGIGERYVELDPLSPAAHGRLFQALYATGRTDEAIAALEVIEQLNPNGANWYFGMTNLLQHQDDIAIAYIEAGFAHNGLPSDWIRELVTGARDPEGGQSHLDRRIPQIVAAVPNEYAQNMQGLLTMWYLLTGFLDRYFELILETDLNGSTWTAADDFFWRGTMFRRTGFTAHPKYLEVAKTIGMIDLWEERGPPDFCDKTNGRWICE